MMDMPIGLLTPITACLTFATACMVLDWVFDQGFLLWGGRDNNSLINGLVICCGFWSRIIPRFLRAEAGRE